MKCRCLAPRCSLGGSWVKIIAVVGSGSGCGKTTVVCRILRAIPGLAAVKISPRQGPSRVEWGRGESGKDTDLYAANGAACVARIVGPRDDVVKTWNHMKKAFELCQGVVVEGSRSVDLPGERFVIFVDGSVSDERRKYRANMFLGISDIIYNYKTHIKYKLSAFDGQSSHIDTSNNEEESCKINFPQLMEDKLADTLRRFLALRLDGK
jgi:hypothetical protein